MFNHILRKTARIKIFLFILVLVWVGLGFGADGDNLPAQNWNATNLTKITGPANSTLTFAVLGDSRDNPEVFGRLLQQINGDPDIAFAIDIGDLVKEARLEQYEQFFFQPVRQHFSKPILSVIGNHELHGEQGLDLYRRIFGPADYSFQINKHYFIVVNDAAKTGLEDRQLQWLEDELQKAQAYRTRLVFLHIPLYDPQTGQHHALKEALACRILDLFRKYGVTQVFASHIHGYFTGKWGEVPYTITGGAGAKIYGTDPEHFFFHYTKVSVSGDKVQVQVRRLDEKGNP